MISNSYSQQGYKDEQSTGTGYNTSQTGTISDWSRHKKSEDIRGRKYKVGAANDRGVKETGCKQGERAQ